MPSTAHAAADPRRGPPLIGLPEVAALLLLVFLGWLVWDTLRAREHANTAMRAACERSGYLFLDDTVSLNAMRIVRDDDGRARLSRVYHFEYSDTGHNRRNGSITMTADRVTALRMNDEPDLEAPH
jgi:hypothetical protein